MGAHLLLVEDTSYSMQLMTYLLQAHGYTVTEAVTGEQAIVSARTSRPDLVVLDLQLPGIDGYETFSALRNEVGLADVPIVAVTSFATVGDHDRTLQAGFDHYLTKPIDPETFTAELAAFLPEHLRSPLSRLGGQGST
jgi:CheY-like chemotaxis protein